MGKVLVIGAGASGISSIKCCIDEGLDPVCYELSEGIGGLWRFTEYESNSSVYRSTVINTSKEMMCFSDFPIPARYPPFMPHEKIIEYFNLYIDNFDLRKRIIFNTRVDKVVRAPDYDTTGRYVVTSTNTQTKETKSEVFDAVMVCSGHHWKPNPVEFKNQSAFKGKIIHSHAYKDPTGFEGKTVVVVGIGNSGVDVAVELSRVSKQVYLSTRSGAWISNRIFNGLPADFLANSRFGYLMPFGFRDATAGYVLNIMNSDLSNYGLKPRHTPLSAHPTINGELIGRIAVGSVIVKNNIKGFTGEKSLEFEDGTVLNDVDAVILCTGYEIDFPFIDSESTGFKVVDNNVDLYKYIFQPPSKNQPNQKPFATLSFIGLIQPWGAIMPISEMQARWVTRVLTGKDSLPSAADMRKDIEEKKVIMSKRYVASKRHTIQVDYVEYMDELAAIIGVSPSFFKLFFAVSPGFAFKSLFFPVVPSMYRLVGPGKWAEAKQAIDEMMERNFFPTRTRIVGEIKKNNNLKVRLVIVLIIVLLVIRALRRK